MRIEDGKEPLDRTSIHPESYKATKVLLKELGLDTLDLGTQKAKDVISNCDTKQLMQDTGLDSYTLKDILDAICMPLRDYREKYDAPLLRKDVLEIEDLHINDKLEGTVRNWCFCRYRITRRWFGSRFQDEYKTSEAPK